MFLPQAVKQLTTDAAFLLLPMASTTAPIAGQAGQAVVQTCYRPVPLHQQTKRVHT